MKTIALIHEKGGSGKSTVAQGLAVAATLAGKSSAILDLDPQGTAYKWGKRRENPEPLVLSVTPANAADEWTDLKKAKADLVLIDTPGRLDHAISTAVKLADLVLIPTKATIKDLESIEASRDLVHRIRRDIPIVVTLNQVRNQSTRREPALLYLKENGFNATPAHLGHLVAFEDADILGKTPLDYAPSSKAAKQLRELYNYLRRRVKV